MPMKSDNFKTKATLKSANLKTKATNSMAKSYMQGGKGGSTGSKSIRPKSGGKSR